MSDPLIPSGEQAGSWQSQFAAMRERFCARVRDDYAILVQHRQGSAEPTPEMKSLIHRLAGSAGMLGFSEISDIAGHLDDAFAEPNTDTSAAFQKLLSILEETIATNNKGSVNPA
jgi:HPt (histidine-containing phosphotransfer) domain-containing protein